MVNRIESSVLVLFFLSIVVGTRFFVYSFTPSFHEYEALFIYVSDILLVAFAGYGIYLFLKERRLPYLLLFGFLALALISIMSAPHKGLALYVFLRLLAVSGMAVALAQLFTRGHFLKYALGILGCLAVLQSMIGFAQFATQGSVGLSFLGESPIGALVSGVAKSIVGEGRVLRAYGTFPHPNILGAFLLVGLCALYYFWFSIRIPHVSVTQKNYRTLLNAYAPVIFKTIGFSLCIFIVLLGIVLTFSRVTWVLAMCASLFSILYFLFSSQHRRHALKLIVVLSATSVLLFSIFSPFILPRARVSAGEPSVTERISYTKMGIDMVRTHPLGIGIGNQVFVGVEEGFYARAGMHEAKFWQPIHNMYILIATEVGVLGLIVFLLFLFSITIPLFRRVYDADDSTHDKKVMRMVRISMLFIVLSFALFDHFFWDIEQGRLLFWVVIGIVTATSSRRSMDRISPSEGGDAGSTPAESTTY